MTRTTAMTIITIQRFLAVTLTALAIGACVADPDAPGRSGPADDPAAARWVADGDREPDDRAAPDDATLVSAVASALTANAVAAGCSAPVTCRGTKTCTAWSAFATCGAAFEACSETCSFSTRHGCTPLFTFTPQNRTRSCVLRATGQTCVEISYREQSSCTGS
jgi:hypothetical protein